MGRGGGDRTRDWWLDAHRRYFAGRASREGFELNDETVTVFERFEVVCPLYVADMNAGPKIEEIGQLHRMRTTAEVVRIAGQAMGDGYSV